MDVYSSLDLGPLHFEWKNWLPPIVAFLFTEADLHHEVQIDPDEDEVTDCFVGFRSNIAACRRTMDEYGYTMAILAILYSDLYSSLRSSIESTFEAMYEPRADISENGDSKESLNCVIEDYF